MAGGARTVIDRICSVARYYDISSKANHGDIFIVHDQKSSYRTPLPSAEIIGQASDRKGTLPSSLNLIFSPVFNNRNLKCGHPPAEIEIGAYANECKSAFSIITVVINVSVSHLSHKITSTVLQQIYCQIVTLAQSNYKKMKRIHFIFEQINR